jgi:flavin-dependent dehydrogenase
VARPKPDYDVLVIGAGPAGIACAYQLEQAGLRYKVVDRAPIIGSTWNSLYPSLKLNTSRFFSHMPGMRFPLRYGFFPSGKQYYAYLEEFVSRHDFNIQLGVHIDRVYPDDPGWCVEWHTDDESGSDWYPAVISATGRFNSPILPEIEGMDAFEGALIHASDYLGAEPFTGKRVMVVGNGPSGVDIASELGKRAATPVLLAQRTGVELRPRYPYGLPKHLWIIIAEKLPRFLGDWLLQRVINAQYPERDTEGIKTPPPGIESSAASGTRGRELIDAVKLGRVKSVDAPVCFYPDGVEVENGDRYPVEAVIMATGYRPALFDYLEIDYEKTGLDGQGWPQRLDDLDEGGLRQVRGYPGLYLAGVFYKGKGAMYNFNTEAASAVTEIQAHLSRIEHAPATP